MKKLLLPLVLLLLTFEACSTSDNDNSNAAASTSDLTATTFYSKSFQNGSMLSVGANVNINELDSLIKNKYFIERVCTRPLADIVKCTDLVIEKCDSADFWMQYAWDGNSKIDGQLYAYTYKTGSNPTDYTKDIQLYGMVNDKLTPITIADVKSRKKYIYNNNTDKNYTYEEKYIGRFPAGLTLGFLFIGNTSTLGWSTPSLNGHHEGTVQQMAGKPYFSGNPSRGLIYHIDAYGQGYNVLGLENRFPEEAKYDGDYNDMVTLIRTNPITIRPDHNIDLPNDSSITINIPSKVKESWICDADDFLLRVNGEYQTIAPPTDNTIQDGQAVISADKLKIRVSSPETLAVGEEHTYEIWFWLRPESWSAMTAAEKAPWVAGTDITSQCDFKAPNSIDVRKNIFEGLHVDKYGNEQAYIKVSLHITKK